MTNKDAQITFDLGSFGSRYVGHVGPTNNFDSYQDGESIGYKGENLLVKEHKRWEDKEGRKVLAHGKLEEKRKIEYYAYVLTIAASIGSTFETSTQYL